MPTKILAIDDSKTMRLAIKITFAAEDADVTSVSKGSEAVARAKQMGADVVLVDATLAAGEPSGYDVCRALKQDPATAGVPVVILVSGQTGVDQAQLAAAGGDDWLAKPFDTQELIDKVAAVRAKGVARPAAAAVMDEAEASQSGTSKRLRQQNRTQMGMPSPSQAVAAPAKPAPAAVAKPVAAAPAPVGKPAISPASLAAKPAAPATPAAPPPATRPAAAQAAPAPAPAQAAARPVATPAAARPATPQQPAAAPRPAAAAMARPAGPAAGGSIPLAIPIPFTPADSPTPGMVERLRQAAAAGSVDPKVAEAIAALSREVIEAIVWEVVPELAESIIRKQAKSA
jgi:CheY-like chemotaxis protein